MELEVKRVPIGDLVEYEGNAKLHTHEQVEEIANSIREFGFNDPIAAWHNPEGEAEIIEGHGRLRAARLLGLGSVPVIFLDGLTDEQRRAYAIVHNKTTMDTGFDPEAILRELEDIGGYNWEAFGFDPVTVSDAIGELDDWRPVRWEDDEVDNVATATVVVVRLRGEAEKAEMLERVGGTTLRRMYRVGDLR